MSEPYDVFVIGAGVAGLAAALESAGKGLRVAQAEHGMFGGLATNINHLWPVPEGMPEAGSDLAAEMMMEAMDKGVESVPAEVTGLAAGNGVWTVHTSDGDHSARTVIVASGASQRKLGVPGEAEFENRGVSTCADCDGPMLRGKPAIVVGGGDSALQEALALVDYCPVVHLVHRGDAFSARQAFVDKVAAADVIRVRFNTVVDALEGEGGLSAVRLRDLSSGETDEVEAQGFFAMVGLEPNAAFLPASFDRDGAALKVDDARQTSAEGVYAIGAVRAGFGGEIGDAMEDARQAVASICRRLGAA